MKRVMLLVPALLLVGGCGESSEGSSAGGGGVQVAAAFYPLAFVAEKVGGPDVSVTNLTKPGIEPHDMELSIAETSEVAEADLVIVEEGFQPAVDDAVEQSATGTVLDAADLATGDDPHFWQDPTLMAELAGQVAEELAELDPAHATGYRDRASDLRSELTALDTEYDTGLADCERDVVVVSHDAFGYLTRYGLEFAPIAGLSPDAEPTPADLGRLQRLIEEEGITTVFSERLVSPQLSESLATDMGITTAVLDPLEGLSEETTDEDYLSLMRENLSALELANGCP